VKKGSKKKNEGDGPQGKRLKLPLASEENERGENVLTKHVGVLLNQNKKMIIAQIMTTSPRVIGGKE